MAIEPIRVELSHATAIFTTRQGGVSAAPYDSLNLGPYVGDDPESVETNLSIVREYAGLDRICSARQVHGARIAECGVESGGGVPEADGLVTGLKGVGLLVTVADCVPVALSTPSRAMMLHCGWRPLAQGIVESALEMLAGEPVEAVVGPGIGFRAYEVGPEVAAALGAGAEVHHRDGRLDLAGLICDKLAGVDRVEIVEGCAHDEPERFFSHRRDGEPTGRQAGVIWRR